MTRSARASLIGLFAVYLVLLVWAILWKLGVPYVGGSPDPVKLVPFVSTDTFGPSAPREVAANVALFVPFGLYLGLLAPTWSWWKSAAVVAGASLALEVAQSVLAVGAPDVSDVVANTAGSLVGIGALALARRWNPSRTLTVMARACAIGTGLAVVAVGTFLASPLHHAPPQDVGPLRWLIPSGDQGWSLSPSGR